MDDLDLTIPDFLNRKLNPIAPATYEERMAFCPVPMIEEARRNVNEEAIKEEKKQKARARIVVLKERMRQGDWKKIPEKYIKWDMKRRRFYDVRDLWASKLAAARERLGLPPLSREQLYAFDPTKPVPGSMDEAA